jgi:hypothetical protein
MMRIRTTNPECSKHDPMPAQAVTGLIGTASVRVARSADISRRRTRTPMKGRGGDARHSCPASIHSSARAPLSWATSKGSGLAACDDPARRSSCKDASSAIARHGRAVTGATVAPRIQGRIARRRPGPPHEFSSRGGVEGHAPVGVLLTGECRDEPMQRPCEGRPEVATTWGAGIKPGPRDSISKGRVG